MMGYSAGFCLSVIHNNEIQREFNRDGIRTVSLPFGSEYKLRLKNNHGVRALAEVTLDGVNIMSGGGKFVLPAYGTIDLERFVDSLSEGRRFKFENLEKAAREGTAQDPTSPENGVIRVRFYREEPRILADVVSQGIKYPGSILRGINFDSQPLGGTYSCVNSAAVSNTAGCTVEGSTSSQQFVQGVSFDVESSWTEIVIRLKGLDPAREPCWQIQGGFGKPLKVLYQGSQVRGVRKAISEGDRVLLEIDPLFLESTR